MPYTNKLNLPAPIAAACENDPYDNAGSDYTASQLPDSPRIVELKRRHKDEIVEDVADCIFRLFGSAVHAILERSGEGGERELRLHAAVAGLRISGATDYVEHVPGVGTVIWDYKVVGEYTIRENKQQNGPPTHRVKPEYEAQLNICAHLRRANYLPVDALKLAAILRDWKQSEAAKNPNYFPHPVAVLPVAMWSPSRVIGYMKERIKVLEAAKVTLPHCTPAERWGGRRCQLYCPVKQFCIAQNDGQVGPVLAPVEDF